MKFYTVIEYFHGFDMRGPFNTVNWALATADNVRFARCVHVINGNGTLIKTIDVVIQDLIKGKDKL